MDKFEPVSGGGEMDHAEEAVGQLVVAGGDSAVDLQVAEHALDAVALLVERPVILDSAAAVRSAGNDSLDLPYGKIGTDGVGVIAFVCKESVGRAFG